jgi:transcriptional regulator with XRE-family HTH domain
VSDLAESIDSMLVTLRLERGLSQLRLAELLCAASGCPTLTRHEISRWERGDRVPSRRWQAWLAVVLEVPVERLEAAAGAVSRLPAARRAA